MGVLLRGRAAGAPDSGLAESGERHCQRVSRPPPRNDGERARDRVWPPLSPPPRVIRDRASVFLSNSRLRRLMDLVDDMH